jgi:nicotinate-nucleotide adenylyltransferase
LSGGRTGLLGGTFDPVHNGHLILARAALEEAALDRVIFMPTGHSWRKPDREIAPAEDRLAMLRLAVEADPLFEVSDMEVCRGGPTYTVDTLEELHALYPGDDIFFILGRDALMDMPSWRSPERIVELASFLVASRPGVAQEDFRPVPGLRVRRVAMPLVGISATDIRRRVGDGKPIDDLVPPAVAAYIRIHGLYR